MTVQELINRLEKVENKDMEIRLHATYGKPLAFIFENKVKNDVPSIVLLNENDINVKAVLDGYMTLAVNADLDELDVYMELLDAGFTVDVVRKYLGDERANHMKEFCENHGLI